MNKFTKTVAAVALGVTFLFSSVTGASAATYTVKSGDTLSTIAKKYNTSYTELMKLNQLSSTKIKVGQQLEVEATKTVTTTSAVKSTAATNTATSTYVVKKGDTLSAIAKLYGTTYSKLMTLNNLTSTALKVGQKLKVTGTVATTTKTSATTATLTGTKVVAYAQTFLGKPYVFGGASPSGFDCSGFVYYVYKNLGKSITRTTAAGMYAKATKVSTPQVGDLVFFSNTYKAGISHVGIYIGNGNMINASGTKVNTAAIHTGYWKKYFTGYGRL